MRTPLQQLVDARLGENRSLDEFVAARRHAGRSWRAIAEELNAVTGMHEHVNHANLHRWYAGTPYDTKRQVTR